MRTVLLSSAVHSGPSSIGNAATAARTAIAAAGLSPDVIDALINTGVYRDRNMVEPAMSALIQKQGGIGLQYATGRVPSYSFDLMNGACGVLNAVQVAQSLIDTGSARYVVITSGDAHPADGPVPDFPIAPFGGALVLGAADVGETGFGELSVSADDETISAEGYLDLHTMGASGRSMITVERRTSVETLLAHAGTALSAAADGLDPARTLLICSRPTPDFAPRLAVATGFHDYRVADRDAHTSSLTVAYHDAAPTGFDRYDHLLFVAAGGGPAAAAIGYTL